MPDFDALVQEMAALCFKHGLQATRIKIEGVTRAVHRVEVDVDLMQRIG